MRLGPEGRKEVVTIVVRLCELSTFRARSVGRGGMSFPPSVPVPFVLLSRLRHETRSSHDRLERHPRLAPLTTDTLTRETYAALLERLLGFYEPLEEALGCHAERLGLGDRWKVDLLVRDLDALGRTPAAMAALPRCAALPDVAVPARALGCFYVLEGATLGGAVIRRHLARSLGITPATGGAFYASYGRRIGPMWKAFCARMETYEAGRWPSGAPAVVELDEVVGAAHATFQAYHEWLSA